LGWASRLDAFALILSIHSYPAIHLVAKPVDQRYVQLSPLVLKPTPLKYFTPVADRDRPVSRRSEPSSRAVLIGEQPNAWELLHPRATASRHRGAEHCRRCGRSDNT